MAQPPKPQAPRGPSLDEPYVQGDPIPAPDAIEKSSDTVWALWSDVAKLEDRRYADTVPVTVPGAAVPSLRPSAPPELPKPGSAPPRVTIDDLIAEARKNNRVCPKPAQWLELYALLQSRAPSGDLVAPLVGDDWATTPSLAKRMAFRDHLERGARYGLLDEVYGFLRRMPEEHWHHMGE